MLPLLSKRGGEELGDQGKENDSEEDEESESEEEIVVEEEEEKEVVQRNSRGRPITASSRDTVPINQSIHRYLFFEKCTPKCTLFLKCVPSPTKVPITGLKCRYIVLIYAI